MWKIDNFEIVDEFGESVLRLDEYGEIEISEKNAKLIRNCPRMIALLHAVYGRIDDKEISDQISDLFDDLRSQDDIKIGSYVRIKSIDGEGLVENILDDRGMNVFVVKIGYDTHYVRFIDLQ